MVNVTYDACKLLILYMKSLIFHFDFQPGTLWRTSRMAHQFSTAWATCRLLYVPRLWCGSWFQELGFSILVFCDGKTRCLWYTYLWLQSRSFLSKYVPWFIHIHDVLIISFSGFSGAIPWHLVKLPVLSLAISVSLFFLWSVAQMLRIVRKRIFRTQRCPRTTFCWEFTDSSSFILCISVDVRGHHVS